MNWSQAMRHMKQGGRVTRAGWPPGRFVRWSQAGGCFVLGDATNGRPVAPVVEQVLPQPNRKHGWLPFGGPGR